MKNKISLCYLCIGFFSIILFLFIIKFIGIFNQHYETVRGLEKTPPHVEKQLEETHVFDDKKTSEKEYIPPKQKEKEEEPFWKKQQRLQQQLDKRPLHKRHLPLLPHDIY